MRPACCCCVAVLMAAGIAGNAMGAKLDIVAAESVYGDLARQLGGDDVTVTSILTNPDQDPHLFEASPSTARMVSSAQIVICNGADYDPWIIRLLAAAPAPHRKVIVVASLAGHPPGDNPHVWFDINAIHAFARALAESYTALDPAHASAFQQRRNRFDASLAPIEAHIASLRQRFKGAPVTATEPVFGYLLDAIGLASRNQSFQRAAMNDTEASASDVATFEDDLRLHRVRLLIYNQDASNPVADRMRAIAAGVGVPIVGVSEIEPKGMGYQAWISAQLDAVGTALQQSSK